MYLQSIKNVVFYVRGLMWVEEYHPPIMQIIKAPEACSKNIPQEFEDVFLSHVQLLSAFLNKAELAGGSFQNGIFTYNDATYDLNKLTLEDFYKQLCKV